MVNNFTVYQSFLYKSWVLKAESTDPDPLERTWDFQLRKKGDDQVYYKGDLPQLIKDVLLGQALRESGLGQALDSKIEGAQADSL